MKLKTVYICSECGARSPKWMGKCTACGAWNSFVEDVVDETPTPAASARHTLTARTGEHRAVPYREMEMPDYIRTVTGLSELDRVLGGGLVLGSVVLLAGEPGIGKSTLLMQISDILGAHRQVLYVSGEESAGQLKLRAERLGVKGEHLSILTETNLDKILSEIDRTKPDLVIVDSIQTVYNAAIASTQGTVTQVRETALAFINKAKSENISVILVGHVNKEGSIAGPKLLEHMVDAVLYFEGERQQAYRVIRAIKNRYGSTNEIGVFEMTDEGLSQVQNPSEMLLADRPQNTPGNCALCTMEGTRPLIAEIQALVSATTFPTPRRTCDGIDYNRLCLILALLEKRLGLRFSANDVYINVIGGLRLVEPAADLSLALALISSLTDRPVPDDLIALGELGLSGECRAVSGLEYRVKEAERLGFSRVLLPARNLNKKTPKCSIELIPVRSLFDAVRYLSPKEKGGNLPG